MPDFVKNIFSLATDRILIVLIIFGICTYVLLASLFNLQIVNGESFQGDLRKTEVRELPVSAPRGEIYDRYGRPLAVNVTTYTLKLNPSAEFNLEKINESLYDLMLLFEANGEKYIDEFPISKDEPYTFNFSGSASREWMWRRDMNIPDSAKTAGEVFAVLRERFGVAPELSNEEARKIVSLRSAIYMKRYSKFSPITLAVDVSDKTMAVVEEETEKYIGLYVEPDYVREYPGGITMSHAIGYIGKINDSDLEIYKEYGNKAGDIVGKTGLEQALELNLRGKEGKRLVETDTGTGQVLSVLETSVEPTPGDRFFLTIDSYMQDKTYEILENKLTEILINLLRGKSNKDFPLTVMDLLTSMIRANSISVKKIWQANDTMYGYKIKEYVMDILPEADISTTEGQEAIREAIALAVEKNNISMTQVLLVMVEQGIITADDVLLNRIKKGSISPLELVIQKLEEGEITPQMTNLDPSTGSVVILDVNTGAVLTAVSYPSYDNNEMVKNFNEYFPIINSDVTAPSYYRAFRERRAPGSTFKMITAVTGLEEGAITTSTKIYDDTVFTKAGEPYLKCWSSVSHGSINVIQAITVSCNCFFCETAYKLGNAKNGNPNDSINALNRYMIAFGLNERTGVEIGEAYDTRSLDAITQSQISSPEYKEYLDRMYDKNAISRWYDGDTVATAIGQAKNNYTAASMAKYISVLANGGTRYKLYLTARQEDYYGNLVKETQPEKEGNTLELMQSTWNAVYSGMYDVVHVANGSGYNAFKDFPIEIGGKTGTAQEKDNRNEHTAFAGFAPYDNPQIAIYVMIPFGNTSATPTAAAYVAREVLEEYFRINAEPEPVYKVNELSM